MRIRHSSKAGTVCPRCGSAMLARRAKYDGQPFLRCIRFPACNGTVDPAAPPEPRPRRRRARSAVRSALGVVLAAGGSIVVYLTATSAGHVLAQALAR